MLRPTSFTAVVGACPFVVLHIFWSQTLPVPNTTPQFFLGYQSGHAIYPSFHPLFLIAFELLPNFYCRVSILHLPSSSLCHCHSLLRALQPLLCFVPSYTMKQCLRADPQDCDTNSRFWYFWYTYWKVLGPILTEKHFEFCCELVGQGTILLFLFWLMQISPQKLISLLRRPCFHRTSR